MSKNSILAVPCGVVAMTVIDLAVVNVALPSIQAELHAKAADLQLVVVAYGVLVAGFLLLGGRTGDLVESPPTSEAAARMPIPATRTRRCPTSLGMLGDAAADRQAQEG